MFLQTTMERNPRLIEAALEYHQAGLVPPNTYLIDYDTVRENARLLAEASRQTGIALYFITKQIGHNPPTLAAIQEGGLTTGTCVDVTEAYVLASNGVRLGNAGHLTQIPVHDIEPIISQKPEVITVFGYEKATQISSVASRRGVTVDLVLRVHNADDFFYPGQVGGVALESLRETALEINTLPSVRVVGVTSYPCLLFNETTSQLELLPNLETVLRARDVLRSELGDQIWCVNTPGVTCVRALSVLQSAGVTHAEPGHALTGTTPLHAAESEPEAPAIVYITEVSHIEPDAAYIYGGGFYSRSGLKAVLVGNKPEHLHEAPVKCSQPPSDKIDYYGRLDEVPARVAVGDTVIAAFRTQIFVTRSYVAAVKGLHSGEKALLGLWDSRGRRVTYGVEQAAHGGVQ